MKKKTSTLLSVMLLSSMVLTGFAGCGGNTIDASDPHKLEIYVYNAGYGYKWAEDILASFVAEPWVQEKYPGIEKKAEVYHDEVGTYAKELLNASKKVNKYDLVVGSVSQGNLAPGTNALELTEVVYNSEVPGEGILYKNKLQSSYLESAAYVPKSGIIDEKAYYHTNWATSTTGLYYNATKLEALGFEVPNTTDELLAIMEAVKNRTPDEVYSQKTSFVTYGSSVYAYYLSNLWWGQYEGIDEYINFYNGYDSLTESLSPSVLRQQGRYEMLCVMEEILHRNNGYTWLNPNTGREAYRETQNRVLLGNGLFMANGDWVETEMATLKQGLIDQTGSADTVTFMRTPIISAIIDKTPSIPNDATLSAVVEAIDAGETEYEGVDPDDFATIKAARGVVNALGHGHTAFIPSYASGKDPAIDFLRYMATDKANDLYIKATGGATLPFQYNLKEKNTALYESIAPLYQDVMDYYNEIDITVLPPLDMFPFVRDGGFNDRSSGDTLSAFTGGMSKGSYSSLAELLFEREYNYWANNNNANWKSCLAKIGING